MVVPALRTDGDLAGRTSRGAVVTLGGEFAVRLIALAVTVAVAVRLDAEGYGIVLLAIAVHGFVDVLTNPMLATVLLREPHLGARTIDIAWTIAVARGAVLTAVTWCLAPSLAAFWPGQQETLTGYFRLLACSFVLTGFTNLHAVQLRRGLRFLPAFLLESAAPITSSAFALVALACSPEPVWLVAAHLAGPAATMLLSLLLVAPRPRFAFDRDAAAGLWRSAAPLLLNGVLAYLLLAGDVLVVEQLAGAAALGIYGLAQRWSQMPLKLVVQGLQNVLMPVYVRMRDDQARTRHFLNSSLSTVVAVVGLLAALVLVFADDLFALLGGSRWSEAGAVARAFVPFSLAFAVSGCLGPVLIVHGRLRWLNRILTAQVLGFLPAMYLGHLALGVPGIAVGVSAVALVTGAAMLRLTGTLLDVPQQTFARVLLPPLATTAVAVVAGWLVVLPVTGTAPRLVFGSAVTVGAFVVCWERFCRRPTEPRVRPRSLLHLARMLAR